MFHDDELEESEKFYVGQPRVLLLIYALYNTLVARSEMVCYFVIILNHMISASMITLVLPILIFLWAMLSVPRPSKRFWMTAIVYTEVCCCFYNPISNPEKLSCNLCMVSFFVFALWDQGPLALHININICWSPQEFLWYEKVLFVFFFIAMSNILPDM